MASAENEEIKPMMYAAQASQERMFGNVSVTEFCEAGRCTNG